LRPASRLFFGEVTDVATAIDYRAESSRKLLHLCTALIPTAYIFLPRTAMLILLGVGVALAVTIEVFRHSNRRFQALFRRRVGFMVRRREWGRVCGSTYVLIGAFFSILLFDKSVAVAVLLILTVSDTAASVVGLRFGRTRLIGKSIEGSLAFFVTALAILFFTLDGSIWLLIGAAVVATVSEALPALRVGRLELNDNLLIPLVTGCALHVLFHFFDPGSTIALAF
jgi:dolichol kinase